MKIPEATKYVTTDNKMHNTATSATKHQMELYDNAMGAVVDAMLPTASPKDRIHMHDWITKNRQLLVDLIQGLYPEGVARVDEYGHQFDDRS